MSRAPPNRLPAYEGGCPVLRLTILGIDKERPPKKFHRRGEVARAGCRVPDREVEPVQPDRDHPDDQQREPSGEDIRFQED